MMKKYLFEDETSREIPLWAVLLHSTTLSNFHRSKETLFMNNKTMCASIAFEMKINKRVELEKYAESLLGMPSLLDIHTKREETQKDY